MCFNICCFWTLYQILEYNNEKRLWYNKIFKIIQKKNIQWSGKVNSAIPINNCESQNSLALSDSRWEKYKGFFLWNKIM